MASYCRECHFPDLDSTSDWLKQISLVAQPIKSTTQIWVVTHYQHEISALISSEIILWTSYWRHCKMCAFLCFCFSGWQSQSTILLVFLFYFILHELQYWEINTIKGKYSCPERFINCHGNLNIYYYGPQCPSSWLATPNLKMTTVFYNEPIDYNYTKQNT